MTIYREVVVRVETDHTVLGGKWKVCTLASKGNCANCDEFFDAETQEIFDVMEKLGYDIDDIHECQNRPERGERVYSTWLTNNSAKTVKLPTNRSTVEPYEVDYSLLEELAERNRVSLTT